MSTAELLKTIKLLYQSSQGVKHSVTVTDLRSLMYGVLIPKLKASNTQYRKVRKNIPSKTALSGG
ncbi:MAG: hypothetical protein EOP45_00335 [Sphingobacteriaceae bacterium]|nr:MAG: hypothetical protein EOP45_00335 [Sphingobacteriaceae bacterium]